MPVIPPHAGTVGALVSIFADGCFTEPSSWWVTFIYPLNWFYLPNPDFLEGLPSKNEPSKVSCFKILV